MYVLVPPILRPRIHSADLRCPCPNDPRKKDPAKAAKALFFGANDPSRDGGRKKKTREGRLSHIRQKKEEGSLEYISFPSYGRRGTINFRSKRSSKIELYVPLHLRAAAPRLFPGKNAAAVTHGEKRDFF